MSSYHNVNIHTMSQKHQLLIANSIIESTHNGSKCENFENKVCNCGYCRIEGKYPDLWKIHVTTTSPVPKIIAIIEC
jgi:hypothetical protein